MKEKISVVVAAYNVEKYLKQCIDSILAQTYPAFEIIIIDDGSIDNTGVICDQYASDNPQIKVIHQHNQGVSIARNVGIECAQGDYISVIDSDDYLKPEMYEKLMKGITQYEADIIVCNYDKVSEDGNTIIMDDKYARDECVSSREALRWFEREHSWTYTFPWNKLYKRELFKDTKYPVGKKFEDDFIIHRLFMNSNKIASISDSLYCYRDNPTSIMRTLNYKMDRIDDFDAVYDRYSIYVKKGYSELYRGTIERVKYTLQYVNKFDVSTDEDKKRIDNMINCFKQMVKSAGKNAGLLNKIIALSPRTYYRIRGLIKRR